MVGDGAPRSVSLDGAAGRRGTNLPAMADFNQSVILEAVRRAPMGLSRVELAEGTGLSAQTVSNICRRLLDADLISEAGKEVTGPGKPRTILRLNPGGRFALGAHLDPTVTTVVLLDLAGSVVARERIGTPLEQRPDEVMDAIAATAERLLVDSGIDRSRLAGLGVAAPGPIDPVAGALVEPPNLHGWHRVALRDELRLRSGMEVVVDKDVTAAAVAEKWAAASGAGSGSFVFLYVGTGIGAGIVVDGEVVRGSLDNAGEVGHIVVDPDGPTCTCGSRGCVAVTCTPEALVREWWMLSGRSTELSATDTEAIDDAFTLLAAEAESGDPLAVLVLERAATRFARLLAVMTNLLDVDRVVLGGPFLTPISARMMTRVPVELEGLRAARGIHPLGVETSVLGDDVAAIGAAALILDRTLSPQTRSLMLPAILA